MNELIYIDEATSFTAEDFWQTIEWMKEQLSRTEYFPISLETERVLVRMQRLEALYAATASPKRKLRKCEERKAFARRKQGMQRIARLERSENSDRKAWNAYKAIEPRYSEANRRLALDC